MGSHGGHDVHCLTKTVSKHPGQAFSKDRQQNKTGGKPKLRQMEEIERRDENHLVREFSVGRLAAEHHGVSALSHGDGDITHLGHAIWEDFDAAIFYAATANGHGWG